MSGRDLILILVILLISAIVLLAATFMTNTITNKVLVKGNPLNESTLARESIVAVQQQTLRYDYMFFIMFMGYFIGSLILAWLTGGNAAFIFIYMIYIVLAVITAPILSISYEKYATSSTFASTATSMPITNHIMSNLVIYITIIGFMGMILLYMRAKSVSEGYA